ncbi:MAG: SPOR domain-containing protein [Candidatus Neomarinimicrobiota bacterium]|nr:SPOR domain-containing protein [Candidatus Neomarinimicrobiota bacterium]
MKTVICLLTVLTLLPAQEKKIKFDESFNPSTLKEPEIKLPTILRPDEPLPPEFLPSELDTVVEGFRVQVVSTQDLQEANRLVTQLSPMFNGEVYIIFDSPNYKLRVGNFRSRSVAELARERITKLGHRAAWIIKTKVKRVSTTRRL